MHAIFEKPFCTGDLLPTCKISMEKPAFYYNLQNILGAVLHSSLGNKQFAD